MPGLMGFPPPDEQPQVPSLMRFSPPTNAFDDPNLRPMIESAAWQPSAGQVDEYDLPPDSAHVIGRMISAPFEAQDRYYANPYQLGDRSGANQAPIANAIDMALNAAFGSTPFARPYGAFGAGGIPGRRIDFTPEMKKFIQDNYKSMGSIEMAERLGVGQKTLLDRLPDLADELGLNLRGMGQSAKARSFGEALDAAGGISSLYDRYAAGERLQDLANEVGANRRTTLAYRLKKHAEDEGKIWPVEGLLNRPRSWSK